MMKVVVAAEIFGAAQRTKQKTRHPAWCHLLMMRKSYRNLTLMQIAQGGLWRRKNRLLELVGTETDLLRPWTETFPLTADQLDGPMTGLLSK